MNENAPVNETGKKKKVGQIIVDVICIIICLFVVIMAISFIASIGKGYTSFFGHLYLAVETDSMSGTFEVGDVIHVVELSDNEIKSLKPKSVDYEGDVVTFYEDVNKDGKMDLNTHRIVGYVYDSGTGEVIGYQTRGDNKKITKPDDPTRTFSDIIGVYRGKISGIGNVMLFMQTKGGFFVCVVLPSILVLIYCIITVILNYTRFSGKRNAISREEAIAIAKAQLLAEQEADKAKSSDNDDNSDVK